METYSDEIIKSLNENTIKKEDNQPKPNRKQFNQQATQALPVNYKDSNNWLAYNYFLRYDFDKCSDALNKATIIKKSSHESEFSIFSHALIKRHQGEIEKAIEMLKKCFAFNSNEIFTLKEIGKSLVLTGKYSLSVDIYDEVLASYPDDWETYHYKGVASMNMKSYDVAQSCFEKALSLFYNEATLLQFGKLFLLNNDPMSCISKYKEALNINSENPELCTSVGMIYLKEGYVDEAYKYFTQAIKIDPYHSNALLALGSINQDKGELEQALGKYKMSSRSSANSPLVWNNLGLCFFTKKKYITALACLKKANYLDPLQWIVNFNLGLVYLYTGQYSSAYIYMNTVVSLKPTIALAYMYLGIILSRLGDIEKAIEKYDRSLELEQNYLTIFNYTVSLISNEMYGNARGKFSQFVKLYNADSDDRDYKEEVLNMSKSVKEELKNHQMMSK